MRSLFSLLIVVFLAQGCATADRSKEAATVWRFDRLEKVGGEVTHIEGSPKIIATGAGAAIAFDGERDALFIDKHPLAGAEQWTIEAMIRPDGGAFEQRWMHLAEVDPKTGVETGTRFLFEIRVKDGRWYLDAFTTGDGYKTTLIEPAKTFALGRWYRVAMRYDGTSFTSYVDGVVQSEASIAFKAQGSGHSSIGTRINRVNYFHGAIYEARFTARALAPSAFVPLPVGLNSLEK